MKLAKAIGALLLATLFVLVGTTLTAAAEAIEPAATVIEVPPGAALQISPVILAILAGTIAPILAGIVSRTTASSGAVAVVNLVVTALLTVVNFVLTSPIFDVATVVILFATTFATGIASYYGVWKPVSAGGDRAPLNGTLGIVGPSPS